MRSFPAARKLLAAAPLALAFVAGCGHSPPPRVASIPAPVSAAAAAPVASTAPVALELVSNPAPQPQAASTPMCDADGRPLAGNVRSKKNAGMCEAKVVTADLR